MSLFNDCDLCPVDNKQYRSGERITLIGGLNVTLCNECHNKWNAYATHQDAFKRLREINKALDGYDQTNVMFSNQPREVIDARENHIKELNAAKDVICNEEFIVIANKWYDEMKERVH